MIKIPLLPWGGIWQKVKDKFLLGSGDSYILGNEGGSTTVTLSQNQLPSHSHTRGTMNIKGDFIIPKSLSNITSVASGAFSASLRDTNTVYGTSSTISNAKMAVYLNAENNWTGETSLVGGNQPHDNMPPYLVVNIYYRIE